MHVKVSSKGWIVIPAALRQRYALKPGSLLQVVDYGGVLALVPVAENPIEEGYGMLREGESLTEYLLAEHQQEMEREQ
jgi:AbrB family looped-hinge helix DNA binding protein